MKKWYVPLFGLLGCLLFSCNPSPLPQHRFFRPNVAFSPTRNQIVISQNRFENRNDVDLSTVLHSYDLETGQE